MKKAGIILGILTFHFLCTDIAAKNVKQSDNVISLRVLFETPYLYDGKEVVVKGEVIGDIMRDGNDYWINIKDGDGCIGVVINLSQKEKIRYIGRYKIKGDIVKISGVYHLHCPLHLGERDIHAEHLEIIESGYEIPEVIQIDKLIGSIVLGVIAIFILLYSHKKSIHKDTGDQQSEK